MAWLGASASGCLKLAGGVAAIKVGAVTEVALVRALVGIADSQATTRARTTAS